MNKKGFIETLSEKLNCDIERARLIIDVYEENFIIGKKNKEKTINNFMAELNMSEEEANQTYNICADIVTSEIKNKIKHPFKSID